MLSSLAIAGYFVGQYGEGTLDELAQRNVGLATTYADRSWPVQVAFYVHIVAAGLALALGPWQFSKRLRTRHWRLHRWNGRVYMVTLALGSAAAFVMSMFNSVGISGFFGFAALAVLWGWTALRGYKAARARRFREHEAWMIRNFALTYAAVTLRLWLGVLIMVQLPFSDGREFTDIFDQAYGPLPYLCWIPNIVVAEFLVRRRNLPSLHMTSPPADARLAG
ncbi:hypothetical protein Sm713_27620 [Streptomyces sp. TS71-3]|nr:hypothetical protein Sm713_27620 [Streptomyces sp. TS71-3]